MKSVAPIQALALGALLLGGSALGQETVTDAVCVDTNVGEFCMRLLRDDAPRTVENFLNYVNEGDFDDTFIHRSEPNFVIQGGGYYSEPLGEEVPQDPPVVNEYGRSNVRGTVAMAKLPGDPDSATNEWFVNVGDNVGLDIQNEGFTVFAEIVKGMGVVDAINRLARVNLSTSLGGAFGAVPRSQGTGAVGVEDLVLVHRVYVTDVVAEPLEGPDEGGEPAPEEELPGYEAVARFEDGFFSAPVRVEERVMNMRFDLRSTPPDYVFEVDLGRIVLVNNPPPETAVYDAAAGLLTLPSVRAGGKVYTDLVFRLTDRETLSFTLESYNRLGP